VAGTTKRLQSKRAIELLPSPNQYHLVYHLDQQEEVD